MPLLLLGLGGVGGFFAAKGTEEISNTVKWGVGALVIYVAAKWFKVI